MKNLKEYPNISEQISNENNIVFEIHRQIDWITLNFTNTGTNRLINVFSGQIRGKFGLTLLNQKIAFAVLVQTRKTVS